MCKKYQSRKIVLNFFRTKKYKCKLNDDIQSSMKNATTNKSQIYKYFAHKHAEIKKQSIQFYLSKTLSEITQVKIFIDNVNKLASLIQGDS